MNIFEPIHAEPAYRKVASAIEEKIMARALKDGDALPGEVHLASQFGVHRSTIREALRELQSKGLITRRPGGKKLLVAHPQTADLATGVSRALALRGVTFYEVWEGMMIVEPQTAALAAQKRDEVQLEELAQLIARFEASTDDGQRAVETVVEFFRALARCSHNQVLVLAQAPLTRLLAPSLNQLIDQVPQARTRIAEAQRRLLDAIRAQNPAEARTWMEKHIRDFKRGYEIGGISPDDRVVLEYSSTVNR
jgi:DNA-binding FadR family transcriptional regulator